MTLNIGSEPLDLAHQFRLLQWSDIPKLDKLIIHVIVHVNIGLNIVSQPSMLLLKVVSVPRNFCTLFLNRKQKLQIGENSANQHLNYLMSLRLEPTFLICHIFDVQHFQAKDL